MTKYVMRGLYALIFCSVSTLLWGQFSLWDGEVSNDWHETKNWSGDTLPAVGDSVLIDGGTVVVDADVNIKSLLLLNGTTLTNNQILTFSGSLTYALRVNASTVTNNAKVDILDVGNGDFEDRGIDLTNNGTFTNIGSVDIDNAACYCIRVEEGSDFTNALNATVRLTAEAFAAIVVLNSSTTFENNGSIEITMENALGSVRGITVSSVAAFTNNNLVTITSNQAGANHRCITLANNGSYVNADETEVTCKSDNLALGITGSGSTFDVEDGIFRVHLNNSRGIEMIDASELIIQAAGEILMTGTVQNHHLDMATNALLDCAGEMQLGN